MTRRATANNVAAVPAAGLETNQEALKGAGELLQHVAGGEIVGFVLVAQGPGGATRHLYSGEIDGLAVIGHLEELKTRILLGLVAEGGGEQG